MIRYTSSRFSSLLMTVRLSRILLVGASLFILLLASLSQTGTMAAPLQTENLPGTLPPSVVVTPTHNTISVGGLTVVKAQVRGTGGALAKNEIVTFSVVPQTGGTFTEETAQTSPVDGKATVDFVASTIAQVVTIQAHALGVTGTSKLTITAKPPASIGLAVYPSSLPADNQSTSIITATVADMFGNAVADESVFFTADGGVILGQIATTDSSGRANTVFRSGSLTGVAVITATVRQVSARTAVTLTHGTPKFMFLDIEPKTIRAGESSVISVSVLDASTNGLPGIPVTLTASSGLLSEVASAQTPSSERELVVTTGANGQAGAVLLGESEGSITVTSAAPGIQLVSSAIVTVQQALLYIPHIQKPDNPLPALVNGNFNNGPGSGWEQRWETRPQDQMIVRCDSIRDNAVKLGCGTPYAAWLGGRRVPQQMHLSQAVTAPLPNTYDAQLTYRYFTFSSRAGNDCEKDYAQVAILHGSNVTTQKYNLCSTQDTNAWVPATIILTGTRGLSVTVEFSIVLQGGALGNFFVDDVSFQRATDGNLHAANDVPLNVPAAVKVQDSGASERGVSAQTNP